MNTKTHVLTAVLIAIAIALYMEFERVYLLGIIIGVLLPDILEPPYSRWHRKFFHSKRFLQALFFIGILFFIFSLAEELFFWGLFIITGYIIHLLGDWAFHGLPN